MLDISKIYASNRCGKFKVTNYIHSLDIEVEFIATGTKKTVTSGNIRSGNIKDVYSPLVFGVGFIGDGDYTPSINRKLTKQYQTWKGILQRSYCSKYQEKKPTYKGCTVCDEWHNFQIFAKWFDENYSDGLHIDKDIKVEGNKVYSPDTCLFVSQKDNAIKAHAKHYLMLSPNGELVKVYNMTKFCTDNDLQQGNIANVVIGKRRSHKGWTKA